jgi:hypothetical protein
MIELLTYGIDTIEKVMKLYGIKNLFLVLGKKLTKFSLTPLKKN